MSGVGETVCEAEEDLEDRESGAVGARGGGGGEAEGEDSALARGSLVDSK